MYFCRTVRKARSATQRPPMLPREIHAGYNLDKVRNILKKKNNLILADLLEEEKRRVMRGNDVEDKIVSKINQSTVVPLSGAKSS